MPGHRNREIHLNALSIGVATGAYALSFGAIAIASGLDFWQTQTLSLFMFTGASQFALVGVIGAGGGAVIAIVTALLLGARNSLYSLSLSPLITPRPREIALTAQLTIDESTAMAFKYNQSRTQSRRAFFATGLSVYVLWNIGTALGALGASSLSDPGVLGLDAAIPAGFLALLWPRLVAGDRSAKQRMWLVAGISALVALVLIPILRPGLPVLASALVAVAASLMWRDLPQEPTQPTEVP
ncbi:MAG: AzlC family ABC transporter permease [Candidatus Nanopelagicales bacterium]|nr:AzlC family ABC transporter permease [Candidatus Nanopelagicales bacterium]